MRSDDRPPAADWIAGRSARIWEIDFLRGLSIILMVFYHGFFDLNAFAGVKSLLGVSIDLAKPGWVVAEYFFAAVFVILSGISSTFSRGNVRRALKILAVAVVVSLVTFLFDPRSTIYFGILHCLGVSILVYGSFFSKAGPVATAGAGVAVLALSWLKSTLFRGVTVGFDWLLPFGIHSPFFSSFDYFPLLPWLGVFLIGSAVGKSVYAPRRSIIPIRIPETFVNFAGRHSLLIYIVHQPVIMGVLYLFGYVR